MGEALNTAFVLTMRYQSPTITLEEVRRQWLPHLSEDEARRKASNQTLPFPAFKADKNSRKSPYLVNVAAVAAWLDNQSQAAVDEWQKVNG
nr:pyocin activator PrtN family protein [uncultured Kingella sp.]